MEKIKEKYFYPMSVSSIAGKRDSTEDTLARWDKFDLLGEVEKNILISKNIPVVIKKIATKFNLLPVSIEEISRLIREVYFKDILKSNVSHELVRKIPVLKVEEAQEISEILNDEVFNLKLQSSEELEMEKSKLLFVQMKLSEALLQYPKLGEQNVTGGQIKLRYSPMPMRPSIKNWMTDYHDSMGAMTHSPIDRGNFLFHSENGKKLSPIDRQKLGTILKSLDEQTPLTIDPDAQVVVFEIQQEMPRKNPVSVQAPKRETLPDVNLRQVQPQQEKFQGFLAKVENKNRNTMAASDVKKEGEKKADFFEIPQSKPPIGSDHYNVEKAAETEKSQHSNGTVGKVPSPASTRGDDRLSTRGGSALSGTFSQKEKEATKETFVEQDRNTMSDDSLYKMLQEKKIGNQNANPFAGNVSFSSPQKLPVEQPSNPAGVVTVIKPVEQQSTLEKKELPKPQAKPQQISPFHIAPSSRVYEKKEITPKINGNVVDLKN